MSHILAKAMPHAKHEEPDHAQPAASRRSRVLFAALGGVAAIAAFALVRASA